MDKCKGVGMKATWVMTEEEKQEKKEAAQARKRIKLLGGHQSNLVDSSDLPTSSYLIKRAQDRRCRKRQITGSSSRSLEIEEDEEMSTDEIENAGMMCILYVCSIYILQFFKSKFLRSRIGIFYYTKQILEGNTRDLSRTFLSHLKNVLCICIHTYI